MVLRKKDLEWLKEWRGDEAVKIIAGVRRCGKSTLLLQYRDALMADGVKESNILFINFEDLGYLRLRQPEELSRHVAGFFEKKDGPFLSSAG